MSEARRNGNGADEGSHTLLVVCRRPRKGYVFWPHLAACQTERETLDLWVSAQVKFVRPALRSVKPARRTHQMCHNCDSLNALSATTAILILKLMKNRCTKEDKR